MAETAKIELDGKTFEFPVIEGSENEKAIDIRKLRGETGYITYDPGYTSTASCESKITYIDGAKGILRHRGYDIKTLAESSNFLEVSYLLINGDLPNQKEQKQEEKVLIIRLEIKGSLMVILTLHIMETLVLEQEEWVMV